MLKAGCGRKSTDWPFWFSQMQETRIHTQYLIFFQLPLVWCGWFSTEKAIYINVNGSSDSWEMQNDETFRTWISEKFPFRLVSKSEQEIQNGHEIKAWKVQNEQGIQYWKFRNLEVRAKSSELSEVQRYLKFRITRNLELDIQNDWHFRMVINA